jgi:hypothetical protein
MGKVLVKLVMILMLVAFATSVSAQNIKSRGLIDTVRINDTLPNDTIIYATTGWAMPNSYAKIIFQANVDGTAIKGDSIALIWGYQKGDVTIFAGARDTLWTQKFTVDTCLSADFGTYEIGKIDLDGTESYTNAVDTLSKTNCAVQARVIKPEWSMLIRPWVKAVAGHSTTKVTHARFTLLQEGDR